MVSDFGIADFYHKSKALLPMGGKTLFKYRIHPGFLKFIAGLMIKAVTGSGFVFRIKDHHWNIFRNAKVCDAVINFLQNGKF